MRTTLAHPPTTLTRSAAPAPGRTSRWDGAPARGDPRIPFAAVLTVYAVLGTLWLGFNRTPTQIALTVAAGCCLDMLLHRVLRGGRLFPLSAYITSLSLAILLNYAHDHFLLFLPVFFAIGSKYLLTWRGRHVFNPSLFGVAVTLLLAGSLITAAPAYQWGGGWGMSVFIVTAALALFVFRIGRSWLIASFLVFYALQTALRAYLLRAHVPPEMLFLGTMETPPFYLFVFFMLTDPRTSPESRRGQVALAFAIAAVDLYLHTRQSVFTFFYAAFTVATAKLVWLHGRELVREGPLRYLGSRLGSRRLWRTVAVLGGIGAGGLAAYTQAIRPSVVLQDAGFRFEEIPADRSGIALAVDRRALELVDPRLQHVAKWLLSVGSAVAVADVNNDGLLDFFFTNPLGAPESRTALYLNRGDWRFERLRVPALERFIGYPGEYGLPSGAIFFDSDSDGDRELLVLASFGRTRLLRNLLIETGRLEFEDVSERAGLTHHTTSLAANVLDFDRDGHPDILIGNVLPEYLSGYAKPTRLNLFRLPLPEFPGDRRMLAFMHHGWHNADNGGKNRLLRNRGDGTFENLDIDAMGMPETHWTLAVGTGDLDGDGWTDLYLASDFGRDDLYLNLGGRRFRRVAGRLFGHVGMDTYKGMNSSIADFDRNGRLDVYVSNVHHALQAEGSLLWMNRGAARDGAPRFHDEAMARGALNESRFGWGAGVGDFDRNGWIDILQANGMVDDRLDHRYPGCPDYWYVNHKLMQSAPEIHTYADMWGDLRGRCIYPNEPRRLYLNRGGDARPQFVDAAEIVGLTGRDNSRGVAVADIDNDGRLDAVISNQHGPPLVLRNVPTSSGAESGWIGLTLMGDGRRCTREALGSTVVVRLPGEPPQMREVQAANGFSSQHDPRLHFGLGAHAPDEVPVSVRWCGGAERQYRLRGDRYHTLFQ